MGVTAVYLGGGSGGHLFPALAVAEQLRILDPSARVEFVPSDRAIDREILERAGVTFHPSPARPAGARPRAALRFITSWGPAVRHARAVFRAIRDDGQRAVPVAVGGFVAAPGVQAARAEGLDPIMLNLDAVPGLANRWIARRVRRIMTTTPVERDGWETIAPIVRAAAIATDPPATCRARLGLDPDRRTLFVSGGSQGAGSINALMRRLVTDDAAAFDGWQVIHQTGGRDPDPEGAYADAGIRAVVQAFFDPIGDAWGSADLAIARAGAGSVAEAWANRVPSVFLPYPHHTDNHQAKNANPLERAGMATILTDRVDPGLNLSEHGGALRALLTDGASRQKMRTAAGALPPCDGAARVARAIHDDLPDG